MPSTQKLDQTLFDRLLVNAQMDRVVSEVHVHHTWRPRQADWRGEQTIEGMRRYHQGLGWIDIAQHLTIDPEGGIWTGRDWNLPPASASGFNGNRLEGPLMIEVVGDFDDGQEKLEGDQKGILVWVCARLLQRFGLAVRNVRFHNEFTNVKSCPGTGVDLNSFRRAVERALGEADALPRSRRRRGPVAERFVAGFTDNHVTYRGNEFLGEELKGAALPDEQSKSDAPVGRDSGAFLDSLPVASQATYRGGLGASEREVLRDHVVNLAMGRLSTAGDFQTSAEDLKRIFRERLPEWCRKQMESGHTPRIVLYAHGGLTSEKQGMLGCLEKLPFFQANQTYPIFFVWETGWLETILQLIGFRRGVTDFSDWLLEKGAGPAAKLLWGGMKESAEKASQPDLGGEAGGAHQTMEFLAELYTLMAAEGVEIEIHSVGHSAGSIFLAHALPLLIDMGVPAIRSLAFLAPAIRSDLFEEKLLAHIGGRIQELSMFTMSREYERDDSVAMIYRKSLLYFVSNACEPVPGTQILGLEDSIRENEDLLALFGLGGNPAGQAEVIWAKTSASTGRSASQSVTHGGFDNDGPTMNSVMRRILGAQDNDASLIPWWSGLADRSVLTSEVDFAGLGSSNTVVEATPYRRPVSSLPASVSVPSRPPVRAGGHGSRRRAVCVGIDTYPTMPLAGCVRDANTWADQLRDLDFEVELITNRQATWDSIYSAADQLVRTSRPGDVIVFQFAGHGTQVEDLNGDESDRYDEALVPIDYESGHYLIDDDLGGVWDQLPAEVSLTIFMDCCHSGTNSRFAASGAIPVAGTARPRYLPQSLVDVDLHRAFRRQIAQRGAMPARRGGLDAIGREIHFSAATDSEYAWEESGQGIFTSRVAPLLSRSVAAGTSNREFQRLIDEAFRDESRQHPGLRALPMAESRPLLSAREEDFAGPGAHGRPPAGAYASSGFSPQDRDDLRRSMANIANELANIAGRLES